MGHLYPPIPLGSKHKKERKGLSWDSCLVHYMMFPSKTTLYISKISSILEESLHQRRVVNIPSFLCFIERGICFISTFSSFFFIQQFIQQIFIKHLLWAPHQAWGHKETKGDNFQPLPARIFQSNVHEFIYQYNLVWGFVFLTKRGNKTYIL